MSDPEGVIRTHLINAGVCAAGSIFVGPIRDDDKVPSDCVFVLAMSGFKQPHAYMATSRASYRPLRLNICVRGRQGAYLTTKAKAEAIWLSVQAQDFTGFLGGLNGAAAPQYQGKDRQDRDLLMIYLDLFVKE